MRRALLASAVCVGLGLGSAHADTLIEIPKSKATLTVDGRWTRVAHTYEGVVEIFKHDTGSLLVITRADVPNPDAWVAEKKQAYADEVEKGIRKSIPGYKRIAKKLVDANGVPALDLEAKREGGATVVVRVLLFRTYAVSAAIEVPKGADVATGRAVMKAFAPPKPPATTEPAQKP